MGDIPKIIWQTSQYEADSMPKWMSYYASSWQAQNPDWEYRYQSNLDFCSYLEDAYSLEYAKAFYNLPGFFKGDFWRFYVLNKYGGVYVDIDSFCSAPLSKIYDSFSGHDIVCPVSKLGDDNVQYQNWFIGSSPGNQIISMANLRALDIFIDDKSGDPIQIWNSSCSEQSHVTKIKHLPELEIFADSTLVAKHVAGSIRWSDVSRNQNLIESNFWDFPSSTSFTIKRLSEKV